MVSFQGMLVAKVGGPVFRIGVGGGAASSTAVQGNCEKQNQLDFSAVQRGISDALIRSLIWLIRCSDLSAQMIWSDSGDAEMEQKMNRVIRACIESGKNPILTIHDQVK